MEGFWRCDKFRIRAVIRILQVEENVLGAVANRDDKKRVPGWLTTHVLCGSTKETSEDTGATGHPGLSGCGFGESPELLLLQRLS